MTWGHFIVNNNVIAKLEISPASKFIIVELNQGDSVSVQNAGSDRDITGGGYSTVCGYLLVETHAPAIIGK